MHWFYFDIPGLIPKHPLVAKRPAVKLDDTLQLSTALSTSEMVRSIGSVYRPPPLATRSYAANERFSTTGVTNKNEAYYRKYFIV